MRLNIVQDDTDINNYHTDFAEFCNKQGIKRTEQLEQRFDALACQFAMEHDGDYNAATKTLTIMA